MDKKPSSLQRYEKKSNYSPIWKKIFLKGRILRIKRAAPVIPLVGYDYWFPCQ